MEGFLNLCKLIPTKINDLTVQMYYYILYFTAKKYKLVILCCAENENKSVIVRALCKFQRPQLFPVNIQNIKHYLLGKLKVEETVNGIKPAAGVDFERFVFSFT